MFKEPTVNNHLTNVYLRIEEGSELLRREASTLEARFNKSGTYRSGAFGIAVVKAAKEAFERIVASVLRELERSAELMPDQKHQLRDLTYQRLESLAREMRSLSGFEKLARTGHPAARHVESALQTLPGRLSVMLQQFDAGMFGPADLVQSAVTHNNVSVGGNLVGGVQQGSHGSTQNVRVATDVKAITDAVDAFQRAFVAVSVPVESRAEIESELATIRAQLAKSVPNRTILYEAGKSIRSLAEGVIAGMMTPQAVAAAATLWSMLGV
jgi:uncharacterized protein YlxP (DUF503 family)